MLNTIRNILLFNVRYPWIVHGKNTHVQWSTSFGSPHKLVRLGNHVGIGGNCEISTDLIIGNHVLVGSAVGFLGRDEHSPYLPGTTMFESPRGDKFRIVIEDDVWIGFGAIILSGVTVGRGSVIGAGAIVAKDIPPYSVVIPHRSEVLKRRFSQAEIEVHEAALRSQGVIYDRDLGPIS
jgi:acetyltransferase-like isoleucine patch superfamily enzyme